LFKAVYLTLWWKDLEQVNSKDVLQRSTHPPGEPLASVWLGWSVELGGRFRKEAVWQPKVTSGGRSLPYHRSSETSRGGGLGGEGDIWLWEVQNGLSGNSQPWQNVGKSMKQCKLMRP
jgi:hypothetical protein